MGEKKLHYKMYKDGKKFVFAAIATMSFFVFGGVSTVAVHADTTSENLTAATVNSTSDTKSAVSSAATVASSSSAVKVDSTNASSSSAVKADSTSASSSSAAKADSTSASSSSAAKAETTSNDKPVVVTTIASSSASSASVSTAASEATVTTTSTVPTDTTVATSGSSTSLSSAVDNAKSAGVNVNETAASQYSGTSATSEAVADYSSQVASIDTAAKDYQDAKAKYQAEQDTYQEKKQQYNTAKSAYDEYQKEVTSGTQVGTIDRANNLSLTSEPNATVSIEGTTNYITLDAVKRLGIGGNDKSIIDQYNTSALTDSDLTRTDPYSNSQDHIILMKVGDTVTATYDNLSNTSYTQDDGSSKKIAKIVYKYTLKSSSNNAQNAIVDIIRDPTVTITVGSNTETNNPISMDMGIKFYYEDGTQVDFSDGKAIVSLSSLNHWNGTQYLPNEKPQAITLQANDNNGKTVQVQWNPYQSNEGPTQTNGRVDVVSENLQHLFAGKNVTLSDTNPFKFVIDGTVSDVTSYVAKDANGNQYDTTDQTIGKYTLTNGTVTYTPNFKYDQSDHVEKVGIGKNTFVYLPGSSINNQNGTVYSVGNNEYVSKGAKLNAESIGSEAAGTYIQGWDYPQSKTAYYGSGALILTDGNINFSVGGNSIGQHNNTVMWFAMNANINTPKDPGNAPTAPVAPTAPTVEWHENQVVQTQQVSVTNASRTINYTYANGPKAGQTAADSVVNNATFARVNDSATGKTTTYVFDGTKSQSDVNAEVQNTSDIVSALTNLGFTKADSTQFNQVDSPSIPGYTADKTSVEAANVNKDYGNQTIDVKYNIDTQTAKVSIIDETDNDKNLYSETLTGDSGSEINFGTADEQLKNYLANGYALSTNKTSDATVNGFTAADYDVDSSVDQVFNVYLIHTYTNHDKDNPGTGYDKSDFEKTVTRTIDYTYGNGPKQGQAAAPTVTQNVDFTRNIVTDNVTGKEVQSGGGYTTTDWKATGDDTMWAQVDSPAIASYTPSQTSVAELTPTADAPNTDVHVVYTKNAPTMTTEKKTVNETVSYVDQNGNVLAQPHTASVDFTRQVSTDAVTGEKTYGAWSADQSFDAVT
ncbi:GbpC/Spa domain-containing protein, partial [Lactiplantibacillus pingfangensis]|uniref:GbpC/Spa domain-containing protein n=1 Tax=Lactiplantibacillus pingfangensis TaxID=2559915 RepID=UPI0010F57DCE